MNLPFPSGALPKTSRKGFPGPVLNQVTVCVSGLHGSWPGDILVLVFTVCTETATTESTEHHGEVGGAWGGVLSL